MLSTSFSFEVGQLDFSLFILAIIANIELGVIVWKYAPKTLSRYIFSLFIVAQILWTIGNYVSYRLIEDETIFLLVVRYALLSGGLHAFLFFLFIYTFLEQKPIFAKKIFIPLSLMLIVTTIFALSPFMVTQIRYTENGQLTPQTGPGMISFIVLVIISTFGAFYVLFRKYHSASGLEKTQWRYLSIGILTTLLLIFFLIFLNFVFFKNAAMVPYSHLFTLPFVFFASYAILKHHFLDIRIFATEVFAFLIIGISVVQITFARNFTEFVFSLALLILLIILSILLIKSMHKEIQHRAEEAAFEDLQKLDAAKSEFITIASHQLRTPLSGLKGYIAMAQEGSYGKLPTEMLRVLGNMGQATERLISLADSFLNVSRMRAGSIELNRQETDLVTFVDSVVQEMKPRAQEKDLTLNWNPPTKSMPQVPIDQEKMRTVLMGILDNAVRYTKEGSIEVKLEARNPKSEKTVTLSVKDTGKGLTPEEIKDVFTSFKRGKTAQALWTEGVGLSLYVAKQFVEAHGGRIWAESAGTEKGSAFYVNLPTV